MENNMLRQYIKTKAQEDFVNDVLSFIENKNEIVMSYNDLEFVVDPHGDSIVIYSFGKTIAEYTDVNDFLLNHKIDGKSVIEMFSEIDYSL